MNLLRRRFSVAAGLLLGAVVCPALPARAAPASEGGALVFGVIAVRAVEQTRNNWSPFVKRMAQSLGQNVELRVFEAQAQLVKAFVSGEVDLGWMGNAPALEIVESGAGSVFAQMVTKEGSFGYKSVLVVNQGATKLNSLSDVLAQARNLHFSDGEAKSTSGLLVPLYFAFQKSGINDVKAIFKQVTSATHQQNMKKVAQGEADVATANTEEVAFFTRDFPDMGPKLKVVWESPLIPQSPLVWRNTLPQEAKRRIKNFVVNFGSTADEKQILEGVNNLSRFRPSSNLQLVPIADLEMFKARQAINNDTQLSPAERAQRIDEVIRRGSRIEMRLKLTPG